MIFFLLLVAGTTQAQTTRGEEAIESEEVRHLKEQIIRVILDTDASQLETERERDSAVATASRIENENAQLHAQLGYMRLKLERANLPTPASASALSAAVKRLWDAGEIAPPNPDPELRTELHVVKERLRQSEEARKDLGLALQARNISTRDEGQTAALNAARSRIIRLEAELALAKTQIPQKQAKPAPGQSPEALTMRIRQLEAQNRSLRLQADSVQRSKPNAVKVTTAWQVELRRKMDSIQFENERLELIVRDLRETASRRFDRVEADVQQNAILERTLAEITVREQTVRERERLLEARERDLQLREQRYRDLEEREVRLKMLEQQVGKPKNK
ncbi:MAG: hypothetical protein R3B47_04080 [Bacteroidia bacterium]